jgi:hypothetical protein
MKTNTYLRFSLLLPIVVWGLSLLLFVLTMALPGVYDPAQNEALGVVYAGAFVGAFFIMFYVFGIIIWLFPYILLSLILFFSTYISRARTSLKVFALSPLAMTVLTIAVTIIFTFGGMEEGGTLPIPEGFDIYLIGFNLLVGAMSLIWGYICVGIGYSIYRLLQHKGIIKDETPAPSIVPVPELS